MAGARELAGRVAVVSDASASIGEATARLPAAAGMRVAVCARRRDRLSADVTASGGEAAVSLAAV